MIFSQKPKPDTGFLFSIVGLMIASFAAGFFINSQLQSKPVTVSSKTYLPTPSPRPTPEPTIFVPKSSPDQPITDRSRALYGDKFFTETEIYNFPIYPGSLFINKVLNEPCIKGIVLPGGAICDTVTYTFQTRDDASQLTEWYKQIHQDWSCKGGAGSFASAHDARGVTSCSNNQSSFALHFSADNIKTEYSIDIPVASYKGGYN